MMKYKKSKLGKLAVSIMLGLLSLQGTAWADDVEKNDTLKDDPSFSLDTITVEAKRPDWESKLSPGTVTIIRPDDYKGEQKTLPELLKQVPGVFVHDLMGKGQYTTVTVRGSTAAQVGVFVDGVLFNLGGDAAADISTIPIKNVERIEVYRGYIPARFAGTYMGGVINIVTKKPGKANVSASMGQGSYGGYQGSLQLDAPLGDGSLLVGVNRDQSDGDFKYSAFGVYYGRKMQEMYAQSEIDGAFQTVQGKLTYLQNLGVCNGASFGSWDDFMIKGQAGSALYNQFYNELLGWGMLDDPTMKDTNSIQRIWDEYFGHYADPEFKKKVYDKYVTDEYKTDKRYRRLNDYKNTDVITKWQDDHWTVKGTWKEIDRHLPNPLYWAAGGWGDGVSTDWPTPSAFNFNQKKQKLTSKEILTTWRNQAGNLDYGISVNYLDQDKDYRNFAYKDGDKSTTGIQPLAIWSKYDSDRWGTALDGSYKAGDHLLEFYGNWSREKLKIDGSNMNRTDLNDGWFRRFRNYYEYKTLNFQLQDTITLDKGNSLFLTPSVRYNAATVFGRSHRTLISGDHPWFLREDTQKSSKTTWQLALKKEVNSNLTLRATGGTYYRILNLYEIAGDGASIVPRPDKGTGQSAYPVPEEGKQWDLSAIWSGIKFLGADTNWQITYFGRDADNMLALYHYGLDYFSYSNSTYGNSRGVEMGGNLNWRKWNMELNATYTKVKQYDRGMVKVDGSGWIYAFGKEAPSYQPEWQLYSRLTYNPCARWGVFADVKYVDEMYRDSAWCTRVSALTTVGLGTKYKIGKDFQLACGVNDLFNRGVKQKLIQTGMGIDGSPAVGGEKEPADFDGMLQYPTQGRTYYLTLQYNY